MSFYEETVSVNKKVDDLNICVILDNIFDFKLNQSNQTKLKQLGKNKCDVCSKHLSDNNKSTEMKASK